jgi:hypothetical protein
MRWIVGLIWIAGCTGPLTAGDVEALEAGRTESRPIEGPADELALKAGVVGCAPQRRTGYTFGAPEPITVVEIDGKPVEVATANAYAQMQAAARADGISLRVVSGFRSQAEQQYLYSCYVNCACNNCNLAARPGYSNHQSGYALDLNTAAPGVLRWLNRNAKRWGFVRTVPSEDWHWEYFGGVDGGPCLLDGTPRKAPLEFVGFTAGQRYRNGQWLKVRGEDLEIHHVMYRVDGHPVGASENAESDFAVRSALHQLGTRTLQATAYDALHRQVAEAEVSVQFVEGDTASARLAFKGLQDTGWYRNGLRLAVSNAPENTAAVLYQVGKYPLATVREGESFEWRAQLNSLGYRAFSARAVDAAGETLARGTVLVRLLPGADDRVEPSLVLLSPEPGDTRPRAVEFKLAGSNSIEAVRLSADGWDIGEAELKDGLWRRAYRFNQGGTRRIHIEGLDAEGAVIADTAVTIEVQR